MPKGEYLRVIPGGVFGLIGGSNATFLKAGGREARKVAVCACEQVLVWDLLTKELIHRLKGDRHEATALARSPDHSRLAVGYRDGSVRVFQLDAAPTTSMTSDPETLECSVVFHGHKRAVTTLAYDHDGMRLVSGSQDNDLTVWDIVSESGLFRLRGHTNAITKAMFFKGRNILISSSKDKRVKMWDLDTQHCFKTLVGHCSEVHTFALLKEDHRLITGSADRHLRVWDIKFKDEMTEEEDQEEEPPKKKSRDEDSGYYEDEEVAEDEKSQLLRCVSRGYVATQTKGRVTHMMVDAEENYLFCHGPGKKCEVLVFSTEEELQKKLKKRRKKARLLQKDLMVEEDEEQVPAPSLTIEDEIRRLDDITFPTKLKSLDFLVSKKSQLIKVVAVLNNNSIHYAEVKKGDKATLESLKSTTIRNQGHRSEVRTLAFSSRNDLLLSASGEEARVWRLLKTVEGSEEVSEDPEWSLSWVCSLPCDYALCSTFAPGDRHVVIGTKTGKLQLFEIASKTMTASIQAHDDAIWSLSMTPTKTGIVTGGKDQKVKFWDFELSQDDRKLLTLVPTRILEMNEQITCIKHSADQRVLAVALLDNSVQVYNAHSLKRLFPLFGMTSPVLCMDISSDSTILVTGSADKNVKLWGLDFGDLKKSIYAHDDSVSCVKFLPKTHMFFTGSKDRLVKQWDADNFQHILTLKGHHSEVRALAVSSSGNLAATSSHDFSIRLWEKSQIILIPEEEREQEREEEEEEAIAATSNEPVVAGEATKEVMASKKTPSTIKGADDLIQALDVYEEETKKLAEHALRSKSADKDLPAPDQHYLMIAHKAKSPAHLVLLFLRKMKASDIEGALFMLPFHYCTKLLVLLQTFLENGWSGWEVELCNRCVCFLQRIHHGQLLANKVLPTTMDKLAVTTGQRANQYKDLIGFNLAGLKLLSLKLQEGKKERMFAELTAKKEKKRKRKIHAPVLS